MKLFQSRARIDRQVGSGAGRERLRQQVEVRQRAADLDRSPSMVRIAAERRFARLARGTELVAGEVVGEPLVEPRWKRWPEAPAVEDVRELVPQHGGRVPRRRRPRRRRSRPGPNPRGRGWRGRGCARIVPAGRDRPLRCDRGRWSRPARRRDRARSAIGRAARPARPPPPTRRAAPGRRRRSGAGRDRAATRAAAPRTTSAPRRGARDRRRARAAEPRESDHCRAAARDRTAATAARPRVARMIASERSPRRAARVSTAARSDRRRGSTGRCRP